MAGLIRRGKTYYLLYYVGEQQKRVSLGTDNLHIAKEKQCRFESDQAHGMGLQWPNYGVRCCLVNVEIAPKSLGQLCYQLAHLGPEGASS